MINEVLLNCISAFLRGEKLIAELRDDEWQELIDKAAQQKVPPPWSMRPLAIVCPRT